MSQTTTSPGLPANHGLRPRLADADAGAAVPAARARRLPPTVIPYAAGADT